ncbi:MAG: MBL fold metallo-hydrolase [Oscillospiraceae bacterium]|nr:MBL fold metallo-hydrolase [Oscillospiraceae bacterium]
MKILTLASSSAGNCTFVTSGGTNILIDAGITMKRIREGLSSEGFDLSSVSAVFVTHAHSDHIGALGMLLKHFRIDVYCSPETFAQLMPKLGFAERFRIVGGGVTYRDMDVAACALPHDCAGTLGYRFSDGKRSFAYCTDLGHVNSGIEDVFCGSDCVMLEANHDVNMLRRGPYPPELKRRVLSEYGHLSNEAGGAFAARLAASGTQRLILGHISEQNNLPRLARDTVGAILAQNGVREGSDAELTCAVQRGKSRVVEL